MNLELLRYARGVIAAIPDNVIDLSAVQSEHDECGTVCCAAGWLAHDKHFQSLGLSPLRERAYGGMLGLNGVPTSWDVAMAKVFDTDSDCACELFCVRGSSYFDPIEVSQGAMTREQLSDKQLWLGRVDAFLAQHAGSAA